LLIGFNVLSSPAIIQSSNNARGTLDFIDDNEVILETKASETFEKCFMFGRVKNLSTEGEVITFNTINVRIIKFSPYNFSLYNSGENITIQKGFRGLVGAFLMMEFVFTFCKVNVLNIINF
jgi:hypothetical protein